MNTHPDHHGDSALVKALMRHREKERERLADHHPHAFPLLSEQQITLDTIRIHATKLLTSGALAGTLVLASPLLPDPTTTAIHALADLTIGEKQKLFSEHLLPILPSTVAPLTTQQEDAISALLEEYWGIPAYATLEGQRLNHSYGLIGAEQHLPRFPGDTAVLHDDEVQKGITPATGAWGYFAPSETTLTSELNEKEKYYVAVQTLYLPEWNTNTKFLKDWYKYRKVVVINPANGKLIICDVADAGPAQSTGKQFGGSPEVMKYLQLNTGMQKGPVVLFFVHDPDNLLPLGPVERTRERTLARR